MAFSQNLEEQVILKYFNGYVGTLLDCGANDGVTFSNSRELILNGWGGVMVEPSEYGYDKLMQLYNFGFDNVMVCHCAISTEDRLGYLHESGAHVPNGKDRALVSTLHKSETDRWVNVNFTKSAVKISTWNTFMQGDYCKNGFDFITIDAEGCDWDILKQIDLTAVGCKCLCIEWNGRRDLERLFTQHCATHNMTEIHRNRENIIFGV